MRKHEHFDMKVESKLNVNNANAVEIKYLVSRHAESGLNVLYIHKG